MQKVQKETGITEEDRELFRDSCTLVSRKMNQQRGIGTLGEKTIHAVVKHYLDPREQYHEQKCEGFIADILAEGEIIEIQTRSFDKLRRKLEVYLNRYDVTVVYPIPAVKWLIWIDEETGELTKQRKSPKKGSFYQAFRELYKIKMYLNHPKLHIQLLLINMEEYRRLNGWSHDKKKGSERYDRIPTELVDQMILAEKEDYHQLIPPGLSENFTSEDFRKASGLTLKHAQTALNVLASLDIVIRTGKRQRSYIYKENSLTIESE